MVVVGKGVRAGAAAVALGLALAGPAGVAAADGGESDGAVSAGAAEARAGAQRAGRAVSDARPAKVAPRADDAGGAPAAARRVGGAPQRVAAGRGGVGVGDLSAVAVRERARGPLTPRGAAVDRVDRAGTPARGTAAAPAAAQVGAAQVTCVDCSPNVVEDAHNGGGWLITTEPADVQQSIARLNTAVAGFFDSVSRLLSSLPANPLSDFLSGALLLVRRSVFNQLPSASPAQLFTDSEGQVSGSIGAGDPEGDVLTYRLLQGPEHGLVQIAADGTYTYVPGSDFSGSDTFVVGVSDGGFNLFNPFGSRTTEVVVQVPDESLIGPPVGLSRGFNMTNLSGRAVYLAQILKESGYETRLEVAPPIGFVLQPGDQVHYETTYLYFYTYDTRFVWKTCEDAFCNGAVTPGDQQWTLRLRTWSGQVWDSNGPTTMNCEAGSCSYDQNGTPISDPLGDFGANRAFLLDDPGTVNELSAGSQADKVAQVLDRMCQSNNSASCSFSPKRFEQTQTDWKLAQSFRNGTETTVTQSLSRNEQTSTQTSLKVAESAKVSLFKIVEAGISRETTETWTTSKTWQETYTVPIPPGQTGYLYYRDPIKRVTGDFTATIGNTTWKLKDVNFDTPDPDDTRPDGGRAQYEATNSPLPPRL